MTAKTKTEANVQQAVPSFRVTSMEASLRFYVDGLGFADDQEVDSRWRRQDTMVLAAARQCRTDAAGVSKRPPSEFLGSPESKVGVGVSICFTVQGRAGYL